MTKLPAAVGWREARALGFAPMDADHEEFVVLIDALLDATDASMAPTLNALALHARTHFEMENGWMASSGFPPRACHEAEHRAVLDSILGVEARVAKGDFVAGRAL